MRYAAFLSYNHRDRDFARWLHRQIETYSPPAELRGTLAHALKPVFMDREELASSGDLAAAVRDALENAAALIVICSPNGAASKWVNEEIRTFQSLGRSNRIFCIVASGDPGKLPLSAEAQNDSCFPPALLFDAKGTRLAEPLAADVRPSADGKKGAALKIIAGLLNVPYDTLRQREARRLQRRMWMITAASLIGVTITSGLAVSAWLARNEARKQTVIAEQKSLTAQRTVDFLKSMFADADPSQSEGEKMSVGEVLRRATLQIESGLQNEPAVRGALLTTLGEVYTSLGSLETSAKLLNDAGTVQELSTEDQNALKVAKGTLYFNTGNYEAAIESYANALLTQGAQKKQVSPSVEKTKIWLANTLSASGKYVEARQSLVEQLSSSQTLTQNNDLLAYALVGLGSNEVLAGNNIEALIILESALEIRRLASGLLHPDVAAILSLKATANFRLGRKTEVANSFREVLEINERVLGKHHPYNAISKNNIARIVIEQRNFQEAATLLNESEQILTKQLTPDHDDFAFVYSNIALAKRGLGDDATAETYFLKAIPIARKHKHRTLGLALADLAEIECRTARAAQGLARLDEALALAGEVKPPEPWRAAYVEHIRAACTLATKSPPSPRERDEAVAALRSNGEVVVKHWTADALYGFEATQRMKKFSK